MDSNNGKEIRYFLADKQSWNDVTNSVITKRIPHKGDVINVGKVRMVIKDIVDATSHGRAFIKVLLEDTHKPYTVIDEALSGLENPTIIDIQPDTNEARKGRTTMASISPDNGVVYSPIDRRQDTMMYGGMYAAGPGTPNTMGGVVRSALNLGVGYSVSVTDFGEVCIVAITYTNAQTGRSVGQSFAIIYRGKYSKTVYTTYSNANRYRNCNDLNSAISYIRSKASSLVGSTNTVL